MVATREWDGHRNIGADDSIEDQLDDHFREHWITHRDLWRNFPIWARRTTLKRFLAHYEMFRLVMDLPGDIVELGVYWGASLMSWANFLEIFHMGDRQRQVFGFDNWQGFGELDEKDGAPDPNVEKVAGGFSPAEREAMLEDAIEIFDADRFIPYKPRVRLVKGDICETVPAFVRETPGLRIALLHFDCDMYQPTRVGLEQLWPLVVKGGVVLFDEYGIRPWEGESRAVDEFFEHRPETIRRMNWTPNPGGYVVKGEK